MRMTDTIARVLAGCAGRLLAGCAGLLLAGSAFAQTSGYPDRPVKMIVPFAAGGPTDMVARLIAQKLSEKFSQQFYIENMAGAGGNLGMGAAARAAADGYTILFVSSSYTVNPSLYAKRPMTRTRTSRRSPWRRARPMACSSIPASRQIGEGAGGSAQANPGKYTSRRPASAPRRICRASCSSSPSGSTSRSRRFLAAARRSSRWWPDIRRSASRRSRPPSELVRAGKLRALGLTAKTRSPRCPTCPRSTSSASRTRNPRRCRACWCRRHAEADRRAAAGRNCAHRAPARREREDAGAVGLEPGGMSSAEFAAYIKADIAKWKKVITEAKIPLIGG